jgi:hypothetical protein
MFGLAPQLWQARFWRAVRLSAAAAMIACLAAGCAATSSGNGGGGANPAHPGAGAPNVIRFLLRHDLPLASTFINGEYVGFFLLDTGSSVTVVDRAVAQRCKLKEGPKVNVTGIGGRVDSPTARLDRLTVGGRDFGVRPAVIIDMRDFNTTIGWPVAGILGLDSLEDDLFTFDLQAGALTFEDRATFKPPAGVPAQEVNLVGNLPSVAGRIEAEFPAVLQIDTGSNGSLAVSVRHVEQQTRLLAGKYNLHGEAHGVGGLAGTVSSELRSLTVFGKELHGVAIQVELSNPQTSQPVANDAPILGRMGNQVLKQFRVTFDLPNHRLWAIPY